MTLSTKTTNTQSALRDYTALVTELDDAITQSAAHHEDRLQCRPGCAHCCESFSVLPVEAEVIQTALAALAPEPLANIEESAVRHPEKCPFLIDNLCAIYDHRPLICRTQGLAIAYIDHQHETIEVSACPINFPEDEEYPFTEHDLLLMDPFNDRLAAINREFCNKRGIASAKRISFREILTEALKWR